MRDLQGERLAALVEERDLGDARLAVDAAGPRGELALVPPLDQHFLPDEVDADEAVRLGDVDAPDLALSGAVSGQVRRHPVLEPQQRVGDVLGGRMHRAGHGVDVRYRRSRESQGQVEVVDHQVEDHVVGDPRGERPDPRQVHRQHLGEDLVEHEDRRVEPLDVPDHQDPVVARRGGDEAPPRLDGFRQRLLDQHVDPTVEQPDADLGVRRAWCRDDRRVQPVVEQRHLGQVPRTDASGQLLAPVAIRIDHRGDLHVRQGAGHPGMVGAHRARADDREPRHPSSPRTSSTIRPTSDSDSPACTGRDSTSRAIASATGLRSARTDGWCRHQAYSYTGFG